MSINIAFIISKTCRLGTHSENAKGAHTLLVQHRRCKSKEASGVQSKKNLLLTSIVTGRAAWSCMLCNDHMIYDNRYTTLVQLTLNSRSGESELDKRMSRWVRHRAFQEQVQKIAYEEKCRLDKMYKTKIDLDIGVHLGTMQGKS